MTSRTKCQG